MAITDNISAFILLMLFYIGWIKFPITGDAIYLADYLIRIVMLIFIWRERSVLLSKPNWPLFHMWLAFPVALIAFIFLHQMLISFEFIHDVNDYFPEPKTYPPIKNVYLLVFDMTIGLLLVAITEEFLFRYKLNEVLKGKSFNLPSRYLITSILFALIHAPQGITALIETFLWGLLFFFLYQKSKSLHFVIVIHFLTNFIIFGLMALERFL
ncbi:CPBP family intramembrane glutamic endopeptidase [Terasakiella pusilla]|uniref:CPBP family intramembrane glutamic endopeptidase n=1 Tax=Terasakiella pusilla TaxID=64973 RepID=UPI00048B02A0|nr:CPBP family intramembrane glutamic endopeptidase [Terasakiella pusilla]